MEFIIITGMSGAGKSQAVNILEDMNYYCIDNLPPKLISKFAEFTLESKKPIEKAAVVVDIRAGDFFDDLFLELEKLEKLNIEYKIVFLEADNNVLISRYKELRRPHPLNKKSGSISEGIKDEREELYDIKTISDYVIDTSHYMIADLKDELYDIFLKGNRRHKFNIFVTSFGFKYGTLLDGDLIFDVRFLPNPFYVPELKLKTGNDKEVRDYVFKWEETDIFVEKLMSLLEFLIPQYIKEGKVQLIIGIGCTGGQHRSVALANKISEQLNNEGFKASFSHRDI